MRHIKLGFIFVILILGAIIGTALGELISFALPDGVVKQFFLRSFTPGFDPSTLNLGIVKLTLGFAMRINIIGIIGIILTAYILRWYRNESKY
jgi:hypothetical protein